MFPPKIDVSKVCWRAGRCTGLGRCPNLCSSCLSWFSYQVMTVLCIQSRADMAGVNKERRQRWRSLLAELPAELKESKAALNSALGSPAERRGALLTPKVIGHSPGRSDPRSKQIEIMFKSSERNSLTHYRILAQFRRQWLKEPQKMHRPTSLIPQFTASKAVSILENNWFLSSLNRYCF